MTGDAKNGIGPRGSHWRVAAWAGAGLILLLPLAAMQLSDEVHWTAGDFALAGLLLFGGLGAYELAARRTGSAAYKAGVGLALSGAVLLVWANGAVGVIGSEDNPANLMYGGVLVVGVLGAVAARFEPRGLARALAATAGAQVAVAVIAQVSGLVGASLLDTWALTGLFVALWLGAAWLFRRAARPPASAEGPPASRA